MYVTTTGDTAVFKNRNAAMEWGRFLMWSAFCIAVVFLLMPDLAHAQATTTGTGGAGAAQARINAVATGWQNIVQGVGVAVLVIAWSYIGYMIAFAGKTIKDMFPTMVGTSIAGLAPVLVSWLFT